MQIQQSNTAKLPSIYGNFEVKAFREGDKEHLAIFTKSIYDKSQVPLLRVHSECLTGDVLGSQRCDCQSQLHLALQMIEKEGGMVLYLRQEGRGIGLLNKINAYVLQEQGYNTVEANHQLGFSDDERTYEIVHHILEDFGVSQIRLITNNPSKLSIFESSTVEIVDRVPIITQTNEHNSGYMDTKRDEMGHLI